MYDLYTGPRGRKYYLERFIPTFPPHLRVPQDLVRLPQVSCVNNTGRPRKCVEDYRQDAWRRAIWPRSRAIRPVLHPLLRGDDAI